MLSYDHIVISVNDLEQAITTYREAGFTVVRGGAHASGITHNALVIFSDGVYLELIALIDPDQREQSAFKALVRPTEGYTGYAFYTDDLPAEIDRMTSIASDDIRAGSRTTTDGVLLKWQMARLDDTMSPFVIQDITPREQRVPAVPTTTDHANGVTGLADVTILVPDYPTAVARYTAILGTEPTESDAERAQFAVGDATLTLAQPANPSQREYVLHFGAVPYRLRLTSPSAPDDVTLHGARITFTAD